MNQVILRELIAVYITTPPVRLTTFPLVSNVVKTTRLAGAEGKTK